MIGFSSTINWPVITSVKPNCNIHTKVNKLCLTKWSAGCFSCPTPLLLAGSNELDFHEMQRLTTTKIKSAPLCSFSWCAEMWNSMEDLRIRGGKSRSSLSELRLRLRPPLLGEPNPVPLRYLILRLVQEAARRRVSILPEKERLHFKHSASLTSFIILHKI